MPSFEEMKEILGFNTYYEEEKRYVAKTDWASQRGCSFVLILFDHTVAFSMKHHCDVLIHGCYLVQCAPKSLGSLIVICDSMRLHFIFGCNMSYNEPLDE